MRVAVLPDSGPQDGRLARSARTRRAIVDALRALHHEGDLRPTAVRVAGRAGVSLRTVWQHFADRETLFVEAGRRDVELVVSRSVPIDPTLPLPVRLQQLVEQRSALFEQMAPVWRAARLEEPFSAPLQQTHDELLDLGRQQLLRVFAAELEVLDGARRTRVLAALQVVTGWATWESLRTELHLDAPAAREVLCVLLSTLFASS